MTCRSENIAIRLQYTLQKKCKVKPFKISSTTEAVSVTRIWITNNLAVIIQRDHPIGFTVRSAEILIDDISGSEKIPISYEYRELWCVFIRSRIKRIIFYL